MSPKLKYYLLFQLVPFCCFAQSVMKPVINFDNESGLYHHRNYSSKEYGQDFQNWSVLQDKNGIMVFANGNGVMTYDGKSWTLIETPTESVIRSMAMDESGKIYVGALDDIGFLKRNNTGGLEYESLLPKLKPELQKMGNIWNTQVHKGIVWFDSEMGLYSWNGERIQFSPWPNANAFHKSFFWNDTLYAYEEGKGLMQFLNNEFSLAPAGETLIKNRVYSAIPLFDNTIILATRYDGLFKYDGKEIRPFKTKADNYLKEHQIYTGLMLKDSTFALGTRRGGAVILDLKGNIQSMITDKNGLIMNVVLYMKQDESGDLWICTDNGISRFEIENPFRVYNEEIGLQGSPNDMIRYNGALYVATGLGLYKLNPSSFPERFAHFEKIEGINSACWDLITVQDRMVIASNDGMFEISGNQFRRLDPTPTFALHQFKTDSNRIIVAHDIGLTSMRLRNGSWTNAKGVDDLRLDNIRFNETRDGKVWMSTFSQGATLISFTQRDGTVDYDKPEVKSFGPADGLPEGYIKINTIGKAELFRIGSSSEPFRFDYSANRFYYDSTLEERYGLKKGTVFPVLNETPSGQIFTKTKKREDGKKGVIIITPKTEGTYSLERFNTSRILESTGVFNYQEDGVLWHGGSDGLVRQELKHTKNDSALFKTYLNKIVLLNDSVLFRGIGSIPQQLVIPYASNALRFEFTSTGYVASEANSFQYKLEGYDKDWSAWTKENIKEYSSLWEGSYQFSVRSRNYGGVVSEPEVFSFVILPPASRSMYAYAGYILLAGFVVWLLIQWRSRKLMQEKEALEVEVARQTQEIRMQNVQLEEQSEELKANAEQLKELDKLKSNFFVNISHEFRTPLSLILSPLEKVIQDKDTNQVRQTDLERMHRNAKRLQQLINQLLELAKLESGGMKVSEKQSDFLYFLRVLTASFESLAEIRNIEYDVRIPADSFDTFFDQDKVETILYNLLSNAFKFTPDGGRISFSANVPVTDNEMVSIEITDTGPGIPPAEVDRIFDRFYQVDSSSSREFEGSGIGLSLVKELIQLMKGHIEVESKLGSGTSFKVSLPLAGRRVHATESIGGETNSSFTASDGIPADNNKEKAVLSLNEPTTSEAIVLLIEDNEDLRLYLKENLEAEYQVVVAENGKVGLEKALELIPDLILSDMMMPQMDGFTLCTKIREDERTSHIPFILLTARTTIESKLEGLELGADEYMTKPFNIKEIKVRMKNLLEQRKNLRKSFSREVTIQPKNISVTSVDERFLNHALKIMEEHLGDEQFSVERFAEEIGMSRKNLLRKIKALTDESVNEFIRNFRLNRAAQLLEAKAGTVSEIAYQVGFNNLSYFSKCFKELFDHLPNEYAGRKGEAIREQ